VKWEVKEVEEVKDSEIGAVVALLKIWVPELDE
jgi:hypothetical protein